MNTATQRNLQQYVDHDVVDQNGKKIGKLTCLWSDSQGEPVYLGVQTGWLFGKTHVVPADNAYVNSATKTVRLPYFTDKIKDAPSYSADSEIDPKSEREIRAYYNLPSQTFPQGQSEAREQRTPAQKPTGQSAQEGATVQLREEQVKVGKREVEAGGVRLRKIVRTETVNQPVELKREEIVVERVPGKETTGQPSGKDFQQEDIFIPLCREEAVVEKESRVREEVRVSKKAETERQTVSQQVRKEDIEVQRSGAPAMAGSKARGTEPAGQRARKSGDRGKTAVFGLARDEGQASRIVDDLKSAGFSKNDISVLFADKSGTKDFAHEKHTKAPEGAAAGAGTGGILGGVLGWLVGAGVLAIPGLGPFIAAGPLMAGLSGAAIGAGAGGLIGALVGLGIPEFEAKRYESKLKEGNILISVHSDNRDETKRAKEIFERDGADEIATSSEEKVSVHTE
jgi:uncharacterized protein (TIGR02271 family)